MEQKLHKSKTNKVIDGVCGGLAEYFDIDPVLVRVLFVLITMAGGAGVMLYIVLAVVMPEGESQPSNKAEVVKEKMKEEKTTIQTDARKNNTKNIGAIILIIVGAIFLLETTGVHLIGAVFSSAFRFWPALLIIIGVSVLLKKDDER